MTVWNQDCYKTDSSNGKIAFESCLWKHTEKFSEFWLFHYPNIQDNSKKLHFTLFSTLFLLFEVTFGGDKTYLVVQ